jgi:hypothetical protein
MTLEFLKVIVQPVTLERDETGAVIGERVGDPIALYTVGQLVEFVDALRASIDAANEHTESEVT